jgi:hypothetical protein
VFLLNYFYADRSHLNLAAWQYTAGWDRLRDILPALLFKHSFRTHVAVRLSGPPER